MASSHDGSICRVLQSGNMECRLTCSFLERSALAAAQAPGHLLGGCAEAVYCQQPHERAVHALLRHRTAPQQQPHALGQTPAQPLSNPLQCWGPHNEEARRRNAFTAASRPRRRDCSSRAHRQDGAWAGPLISVPLEQAAATHRDQEGGPP